LMTKSYRHDDPDNLVLPFRVHGANVSGRLVRLGASIDEILTRHAYPEAVSRILGEALLIAAMFGSNIKELRGAAQAVDAEAGEGDDSEEGGGDRNAENAENHSERFILQTQTDGPISLLVADYHYPGRLRGYARFDKEALAQLAEDGLADAGRLLGHGHLAMTINRGGDMERYQGIVALDSVDLSTAANIYFEQSEQLPTQLHLAMARHFDGGASEPAGGEEDWRWRGGCLMIQKLTPVGGFDAADDNHKSDAAKSAMAANDDDWNRAAILADTVKDHELLDPLLTPEELLFRLFHEDGVRVFPSTPIAAGCGCSQGRVEAMLSGFSKEKQQDMAEADGKIHITCEFCNRRYSHTPGA